MLQAWTDYPIVELGDVAHSEAAIREVRIITYDGDKYCRVVVEGVEVEIKSGYLYDSPDSFRPIRPTELLKLHRNEVNDLFHQCWGSAVQSPTYNKTNWIHLQRMLNQAGIIV